MAEENKKKIINGEIKLATIKHGIYLIVILVGLGISYQTLVDNTQQVASAVNGHIIWDKEKTLEMQTDIEAKSSKVECKQRYDHLQEMTQRDLKHIEAKIDDARVEQRAMDKKLDRILEK